MKTHMVFAIVTIALLAFVITQSPRKPMTFDRVIDIARARSKQPYKPREKVASKALQQLNYDQYRDIRWKDEHTLWRRKGLPFQAKFFFTGGLYAFPVTIFQVNRDGAGPVRFSPEYFDFGKNTLAPREKAAGDYSGFRIHYPINRADYLDEMLVFQGASYFRAVAKGQQWGLSARGIALETNGAEEFPDFTTFWLVEPKPNDRQLTLFALLEGRSVTGAYEFFVEPGTETRMHVRAVLFFRRAVREVGIAPLTSMFWYGENTSNTFGNFRPEVHDSDGLLIEDGRGEWLWHPLAWSKLRQVNLFEDENPRGFGLLQRDRDFSHYQDLEAHYHKRPSLWVQPHGQWGKGAVKLVQNPTNNEAADNVVAFWEPATPPKPGDRLDFSYTLVWYSKSADRPPLAACVWTRIDNQDDPKARLFVLDFWGPELDRLAENRPDQLDCSVSKGASISDIRVEKNPTAGTWRATFKLTRGDPNRILDLRCALKLDGRPISETWTYTLMPQ